MRDEWMCLGLFVVLYFVWFGCLKFSDHGVLLICFELRSF